MAVVGLDDLDVVARGQSLGGHLQEFERDVHAHAHVGRHDDGDLLRRLLQGGFLCVGETGRADDHFDTVTLGRSHVAQGAFWPCEVDQTIAHRQSCIDVVGDQHAGVQASKGTGIQTQSGAARDVQSAAELHVVVAANGLHQHLAHAPTGAGHTNTNALTHGHGS